MEKETAVRFVQQNFYFDIHGHRENLLPGVYKILKRGTVPPDVPLKDIKQTGVNGFTVCAIGDPNNFRLLHTNPFYSVKKQLRHIKILIEKSGGIRAQSHEDFIRAIEAKQPVFLIGIEGGDFLDSDLSRLDYVYSEGVRILLPVHFSTNTFGSTMMGFFNRTIPEQKHTGLTDFGRELIKKANKKGILLDLSHADEKTLLEAVKITTKPVICSHTGPGALQKYPRYLSDKAIKNIADTGGVIGLWPFFDGRWGIQDIRTFIKYAGYLKNLIGSRHIAIGTDINAVPGNMARYRNLHDAYRIIQALSDAGFSNEEIQLTAGINFLNLFKKVTQ